MSVKEQVAGSPASRSVSFLPAPIPPQIRLGELEYVLFQTATYLDVLRASSIWKTFAQNTEEDEDDVRKFWSVCTLVDENRVVPALRRF